MAFLYILSEDDNDDIFYTKCLEKITGKTFQRDFKKIRKGGGISEVRKKLRILLKFLKYTGKLEDTYFLVALDNDRSPEHPEHKKIQGLSKQDMKKQCRYCEILKTIEEIFSKNRNDWPVQGAIAIPVQMLESWLLLMLDSKKYQENTLPLFSEKTSSLAKQYYSKKTPDQLKDLCYKERKTLNKSKQEFYSYCCEKFDIVQMKTASRSFKLFVEEVLNWQ